MQRLLLGHRRERPGGGEGALGGEEGHEAVCAAPAGMSAVLQGLL